MESEPPAPLPVRARHPGERDLQRLLLGTLPRAEVKGVVRHLLTGCRECSDETRRLWKLGLWRRGGRGDLRESPARLRPRRNRNEPGLI